METALAKNFFEQFSQENTLEFLALAQSGSSRVNYFAKTETGRKFIITFNENIRENEAFFYFSEIFSGLNLNTPQIFKISEDRQLYIQEYLGENTLSEIIAKEGISGKTKFLVKESLCQLFRLQNTTKGKIDFTKTYEYERYDRLPIISDLFYFKSFIADVLELPYHKSGLLKEFQTIVENVEKLGPHVLMIRDFQARNIMVGENEKINFIDYQSAMQGPAMYDVVSFLYQAKANFPEDFREEMLEFYISLYNDPSQQLQLKNSVKPLQLMRFLQVLGAYGFRGMIQKKAHFLESLNFGIKNLANFADTWDGMKNFPELESIIKKLSQPESKEKISAMINDH